MRTTTEGIGSSSARRHRRLWVRAARLFGPVLLALGVAGMHAAPPAIASPAAPRLMTITSAHPASCSSGTPAAPSLPPHSGHAAGTVCLSTTPPSGTVDLLGPTSPGLVAGRERLAVPLAGSGPAHRWWGYRPPPPDLCALGVLRV